MHAPLIYPLIVITVKTVKPADKAFKNKSFAPLKYLMDITMVIK